MERNSVIMYMDYEDYFNELTPEQTHDVIRAFFKFVRTGESTDLTGEAKIFFLLMKKNFIRDDDKYNTVCINRSEAGKKGGRPSKKAKEANGYSASDKKAKEANGYSAFDEKAKEANGFSAFDEKAKKADNDNENDNENDNDNDNDNDIDILSVSCGNGYSAADASECVSASGKEKCRTFIPAKQLESEFEELWNIYPKSRRQGKKRAYAAYERARKGGADFERIKKGLSDYVSQIAYEKTDAQYVKLAETWFSGEHWQDEYNTGLDDNGVIKPQKRIVNGIDMTDIRQRGIVV